MVSASPIDPATGTPEAREETPASLQQWVRQLNDQEMPAFARTTDIISRATQSSETSASQLAKEILQDPTMTVRVLKMANNIYHNPKQRTISTVNRAIVVLGFETVRSICLSLAIVDSMLGTTNKNNLLKELARSFHAATQARTMAIKRKDPSPEEVYIATLMFHLGRMVFWCFADRFDAQLSKRMDKALKAGYPHEQAERKLLGFTLGELSTSLNQAWHISPLLDKALTHKGAENPRVSNITLGYELADSSSKGWDKPETKQVISRIAETLYLPVKEVTQILQYNAQETKTNMKMLGTGKASKFIKSPPYETRDENSDAGPGIQTLTAKKPPSSGEEGICADEWLYPDKELQLTILTELSELVNENPDINQILEMVLEGIYRGIGMDRTLFAIMSPNRRAIRAKYTLGRDRAKMTEHFNFEVSQLSITTIIDYVIRTKKNIWMSYPPPGNLAAMLSPKMEELFGRHPFFMAPVVVKGKAIGLFYADRGPSGRELDSEGYASFNLFCQQANMGLSNR